MKNIRNIFYILICLTMGICVSACTPVIAVGGVSFGNSVIEMVVGEEYAPNIIITPTFATDKSYRLSTNTPTIFTVDGDKLVAHSAGEGMVTVTTTNANRHAVARVVVYDRAIQLSTPIGLQYDGGRLSFEAVDKAFNYTIRLNNVEYALGSNTYLDEVANGQLNTAQVRATGNGTASISSKYGAEYKFYVLPSPTGLNKAGGQFRWDAIPGVSKYMIILINPKNIVVQMESETNSVDISSHTTLAGKYRVSVSAACTGYDNSGLWAGQEVECISSKYSQELQYYKANTPTVLKLDKNKITFEENSSNRAFDIIIYNQNYYKEYQGITERYFYIPSEVPSGTYIIAVRTASQGTTVASEYSQGITFSKLGLPTVTCVDGVINISGNGAGYYLVINGQRVDIGAATKYQLARYYEGGNYNISAIAYGASADVLDSECSAQISVQKLNAPEALTSTNGVLTFFDYNESATYDIYVDEILVQSTTQRSVDLAQTLADAKQYNIAVVATGGVNTVPSNISYRVLVTKLISVANLQINDEIISFSSVGGVSGYKVIISSADTEHIYGLSKNSNNMAFPDSLAAGEYDVSIIALGDGANVMNSDQTSISGVRVLDMPILRAENNTIVWDAVSGAVAYTLAFTHGKEEIIAATTGNTYVMGDVFGGGDYTINIRAIGIDGEVISSKMGGELLVRKLDPVTGVSMTGNVLTWNSQSGGSKYLIGYKGKTAVASGESYTFDESEFSVDGEYTITMQAMGGGMSGARHLFDGMSVVGCSFIRLAAPTDTRLYGDVLMWGANALGQYRVEITHGQSANVLDINANSIELVGAGGVARAYFAAAGEYSVRVMYIGNETTSLSSAYSATLTIRKLETIPDNATAVSDIYNNNSTIHFAINSMASAYGLKINEKLVGYNFTNADAVGGYIGSPMLDDYTAGDYDISVRCVGDGEYTFSSDYSDVCNVTKIGKPVLNFDKDILRWEEVNGASAYNIYISNYDGRYLSKTVLNNEFNMADLDFEGGNISFQISAVTNDNAFYNSQKSAAVNVYRMSAPELKIIDGKLTWKGVYRAQQYMLYIDDVFVLAFAGDGSYDMANMAAGQYTAKLQAVTGQNTSGDSSTGLIVGSSPYFELTPIHKLDTPSDLSVESGLVVFTPVIGASEYILTVGTNIFSIKPDIADIGAAKIGIDVGSYDVTGMLSGVDMYMSIRARGDGVRYVNSSESPKKLIKRLFSPTDVSVSGDIISWSAVANATRYYVEIINYDIVGEEQQSRRVEINGVTMVFPQVGDGFGAGKYTITVRAIGDYVSHISSLPSRSYMVSRLETPTDIKTFGGVLNWSINAGYSPSGYTVLINDTDVINVPKDQKYLTLPSGTYGAGYYTFRVKALGNYGNILASAYSDAVGAIMMPPSDAPSLSDGKIVFTAPKGLARYVNIRLISTNPSSKNVYNITLPIANFTMIGGRDISDFYNNRIIGYTFGADISKWDMNAYFAQSKARYIYNQDVYGVLGINPDEYSLSIQLIGNNNNEEMSLNTNVICSLTSAYSETRVVTQLPVIDIAIDTGKVVWQVPQLYINYVYSPTLYRVTINNGGATDYVYETNNEYIDFNTNGIDVDDDGITDYRIDAGTYMVHVSIVGDAVYMNAAQSSLVSVQVLPRIIMSQTQGVIHWASVANAVGYRVRIETIKDVEVYDVDKSIGTLDLSSSSYLAGSYAVTITALGNGQNILDSKYNISYTKHKMNIDEAEYKLIDGVLQWKYVGNSNTYNIVINGKSETVNIKDESNNVVNAQISVVGNIITYELAQSLAHNIIYNVAIQALGDDRDNITSSLSSSVNGQKLERLTDIRVEGGRLRWQGSVLANEYIIMALFAHGQQRITAEFVSSSSDFVLPNTVSVGGVIYQLGANNYTFSTKLKGNDQYFNSSYSNELVAERLAEVTTIGSTNGIIVWDNVANKTSYTVTINGIIISLTANMLDTLNGEEYIFSAGSLDMMIVSEGGAQMQSRASRVTKFTKLSEPINLGNNAQDITWDAVENANEYSIKIKHYKGGVLQSTTYALTSSNNYRLDTGYQTGTYKVSVRALTNGARLLNSDYSLEKQVSKAEKIQNLTYSADKKQWQWDINEGSDNYLVTYTLVPTGGARVVETQLVPAGQNFFKPFKLGVYEQVKVQGLVSGNIAGDADVWSGVYVFDLFAGGGGSESSPYIIRTKQQFANIIQYSGACFIQSDNIDLGSVNVALSEFGGVYDGAGYTMTARVVNNNGLKSIFAMTNGAKISNMKINAIIEGSLSAGGLSAGMLIGQATNTTVTNINIVGKITLTNLMQGSAVYVGGIVGRMNNSTVQNSTVDVITSVNAVNGTGYVYIGGVAGIIDTVSKVLQTTAKIVDSTSTSNSVLYIGGIAGLNNGSITNVSADINVSGASYVGGIVAENSGTINTAMSTGSIVANGNTTGSSALYGYSGGIVAWNKSTSNVVNTYSSATVSSTMQTSNNTYAMSGGIIGRNDGRVNNSFFAGNVVLNNNVYTGDLAGYNNTLNYLTNCYFVGDVTDSPVGNGSYTTQVSMTLENMKTANFVQTLNNVAGTEIWVYKTNNLPLMKWTVKV